MVTLHLPLSADACFRAFCDVTAFRQWVPGLKKVKVVRADATGRAKEAAFEHGDRLSYALVYAYDDEKRQVRWVPSAGVRDGVSGRARFDEEEGGCRFTYALDSVRGRKPEHPGAVARAFADWVKKRVSKYTWRS